MDARKFLKGLVLVIVAINAAIIAVILLGSSPKPAPMPVPNGYDDFARAGQALNGNSPRYTNQTRDELEKIVSANGEALKLLHEGVTRECLVPNDYSPDYINRIMPELASFKALIYLLVVEGKFAELDGRTNDAAKIYLDGIRFAHENSRGGVMINQLVGVACEAITLPSLQNLQPVLDAKKCAEAARALEEIDAKADPIANTLAREKDYSRKVGGFREQITALVMYKSIRAVRQKSVDKFHASALRRRRAMISFAARAYELDQGKPAATVADLVPAYLKAVPQDPVTGAALTDN